MRTCFCTVQTLFKTTCLSLSKGISISLSAAVVYTTCVNYYGCTQIYFTSLSTHLHIKRGCANLVALTSDCSRALQCILNATSIPVWEFHYCKAFVVGSAQHDNLLVLTKGNGGEQCSQKTWLTSGGGTLTDSWGWRAVYCFCEKCKKITLTWVCHILNINIRRLTTLLTTTATIIGGR